MNHAVNLLLLADIAYGRSGDKGNHSNIAIFSSKEENYPFLLRWLTADRVKTYFKTLGVTEVIRYEVPNLWALNFVLKDALAGGGSRSLRYDSQGKALAQALLSMSIDEVEGLHL